MVKSFLGSFGTLLAKEQRVTSLFKMLLMPASKIAMPQRGMWYKTNMARVVI